MTAISTDNFTPLYQAIGENKQLYAPKVLNQLSREVYNIAMTGKPSSTLVLDNFEHLDKLPADKSIVAAIGVNGYGKPVSPLDLYEDVLFDNKLFKPSLVVGSYLNKALGSNAGGLPMFKILSQYDGPITGDRIISEIQKHKTMDSYLSKSDCALRTRIRKQLKDKTLSALKERFKEKAAENILVLTQEELADIDGLHELLVSAARKQLDENSDITSPLKKSIRIYDFLKYQPKFSRKMKK
ncbi:hypothetical protein OZX72_00035 [Bifidobacterium sp. ESL0769]|uniref:hypothetical protein n=1 Tax=Bifidobacterium sp. ESL0769 TaxID=2983229 RepID=UPI0023F83692|nr:hypothetical protein [Bifidobacterium sp. ESL0769]WEV67444.1 hypothetical protein OZX72_00035 [Bifidobacterium sp. ESL0769]